ncbi:unnamed protein product [Angiostrongylus costaricensis]|uniref:Uncharacterized protein n=1 Tax=Angiostrongylus costaricensis TaxID=334426 RepID=A0A0R3PRR4_ANGCS|nr:unnamed protein product [Angiostrongylus costaricensis]
MRSQHQSRYLAKSSIRHEDERDAVQTNWINEPEGSDVFFVTVLDENWCYHCASPLKHLSNDMRKTIRQFLHIRRTTYPHVATEECNNARNLSLLHKQKCRHRYCETIALVDHNEGGVVKSFII